MKTSREYSLHLYRWATIVQRWIIARRYRKTNTWPAAILFYHRVADSFHNPWTISTSHFASHIEIAKQWGELASLEQIIACQKTGKRDRLQVAITFDDGYSENMDWVIPKLIEEKIPATYFVTTDFVESGRAFPHDAELGRKLRPNTIDELKHIAESGIQIGGHTASHLDLGKRWSPKVLKREIVDSRKKLQDWTGQRVDYFAFPYGLVKNFSQEAIDMVFQAGYVSFVSAYGGWNHIGGDVNHLARIHGECGTGSILNWLSLDKRKIVRPCPLIYQKNAVVSESLNDHGVASPSSERSNKEVKPSRLLDEDSTLVLPGLAAKLNTPVYQSLTS